MIAQWEHGSTEDERLPDGTNNSKPEKFKLEDLGCFSDNESAEISTLFDSFKCLTEDRSVFDLSLLLSLTRCCSEPSAAFSQLHLQYAFYLTHLYESKNQLSELESDQKLSELESDQKLLNIFETIEELDKFEPYLRTLEIFSKSSLTFY